MFPRVVSSREKPPICLLLIHFFKCLFLNGQFHDAVNAVEGQYPPYHAPTRSFIHQLFRSGTTCTSLLDHLHHIQSRNNILSTISSYISIYRCPGFLQPRLAMTTSAIFTYPQHLKLAFSFLSTTGFYMVAHSSWMEKQIFRCILWRWRSAVL
jgi:hypothetical protein